ncbi:YdeI/OmpD-associated family protein [Arenibacter sp. GZD96]|uniref:YdeI/OmpD-associated family protein n=1 Tax=Aurantibrevibacter litoralis TaxID=3106030 RepID=UPI002AFFE668|nr:YdeI/OmpD-associated family protein [Arenibacter sp. GZD-96]MEA1785283.1 YdeI/OmpD-associated family protein [Arenibacter sp. GZD-96]
MATVLVDMEYRLEKFPGKGGWTYAQIPEILPDKNAPFGWVRVRGTIDDFEIKNYHLMPMGNGKLFLPVKADIRKKLRKQAGDYVHVTLYADNEPTEIPEALRLCLLEEPNALETFLGRTNGEQKAFIDWIYAAKTDTTKVNRIASTLRKLAKGQKLTNIAQKRHL